MTNNRPDVEAEIAALIASMDFSDDPTPPPKTPSLPQVFVSKRLPDGTVVIFGRAGGWWSELGAEIFTSSPAEALASALDTTRRKYKAEGETSQWVRYSSDELCRSVNGTQCTVTRVGGGWMAEVRTHTAQGWFRTAQEAMAAADKKVPK